MTPKVILITGASSGIGYSTALRLADQGHRVYGAARRIDRIEPLREHGVVPVSMDVTDEASMVAAVNGILEAECRIINTSSVAGKVVMPFGGWYNVSKFAVEAFSDALRMEVKPFGIDVSIIEPSGIKTPWGLIAAEGRMTERQCCERA